MSNECIQAAMPRPGLPAGTQDKPGVHPLARHEANLLKVFRMDLQLHFFWSFVLTLLAVFWPPMLAAGLLITVLKEALDWLALKPRKLIPSTHLMRAFIPVLLVSTKCS